jgi:hypothetical protein
MKLYTTTDGYAETVDLDDTSIYPAEWQKMNVHKLFNLCEAEAGTSLFYMDFLRGGDWEPQRTRVVRLCEELARIWHFVRKWEISKERHVLVNESEYRVALMSWLYRFQDETENQC